VFLHSLHLHHFRNYTDQVLQLGSPKTILVGDNAQGKTNVLEAVELLACLKSRRCSRDSDLIQHLHQQAGILAMSERLGIRHQLQATLRANGRRTLQVDGQNVRRQVEFLGQINAVLFSSLDLQLIRGGPDQRRDWLDAVLVQLEPVYADLLVQYRRILKQRNTILKDRREQQRLAEKVEFHGSSPATESPSFPTTAVLSRYHHPSELAAWNEEFARAGSRLMRRRARLLERLGPLAATWHQAISGGTEVLTLTYQPQVHLPDPHADAAEVQALYQMELERKGSAEQAYGSSLVGPHRDDVDMQINHEPARTYGSQGQQRTLVLALKLAELELIEQVVGETPLLLLDDVLAELDLRRQDQLLDAIQDRVQTLVTTTHLGSFDARWLTSAHILRVQQGTIRPEALPSTYSSHLQWKSDP
jgi:DNA replication and repair protein RecF